MMFAQELHEKVKRHARAMRLHETFRNRGWRVYPRASNSFDLYTKDTIELLHYPVTNQWRIDIEGSGIYVMNAIAEVCELISGA